MAKKPKNSKPLTRMSVDELAAATRQFDAPLPDDAGEPLTAAEQAEWDRAKRKRGRPKKGKGSVNVLISVERGLLDAADAFAREHGLARSALVAIGLRSVMGLNRPKAASRAVAV